MHSISSFFTKQTGTSLATLIRLPRKHSSWWRRLVDVFGLRLRTTSSRRLGEDEYILNDHTSSEDVLKMSWSRLLYSSCPYLFKTSSRRLQDVLQKRLQDVLKTYHQVTLFLLTSFWEVFNMFVRRTAKTVVYRRIHLGHTSEKFMVSVQNLQGW